jgi:hypothetical protein
MKQILTTLLIICWVNLIGQNLVPNPSFEDTLECPFFIGVLTPVSHWNTYGNSPDYFHSCAEEAITVPNTFVGYQNPRTGNAMAGIVTYVWEQAPSWPDYRENIGTELLDTLEIGQEYFVSMHINLSGYLPDWQIIAANKTGIRFSTVRYDSLTPPVPNNFAHFYTDSIVTDTVQWLQVAGSFIADSAYSHIVIGNFFDELNTDTVIFGGPPFGGSGAYYFIDDVCVSENPADCGLITSTQELQAKFQLSVFPNPTNDQLNILLSDPPNETYSVLVYSYDGKLVFEKPKINTQELKIDVSNFTEGLYFLNIRSEKGDYTTRKFIKR